ncbi:MAG: hypothetical protein LBN39_12280 [Planctomycetaceae bacterium]|nr:hypothetical protein [Planctomycetaceae bacterium]
MPFARNVHSGADANAANSAAIEDDWTCHATTATTDSRTTSNPDSLSKVRTNLL